ncbi:MAG: uncharacterized protein K0R39_254 [Symbiobacteriaceae bacterium]|jgi:hypothetical protein|nr:uncharacterized protein [Symbiobacteriaceae bacterium]
MRRWFGVTGLSAAILMGTIGGLGLTALSAPVPAFSYDRTSIISWRGNDDHVPNNAATVGWSGPMFYITAAEGAQSSGPEGRYPSGKWAPGDAISRVLTVKNVDSDDTFQVEQLRIRLAGDAVLAPRLALSVQNQQGEILYAGTLADFAGDATLPLARPVSLPRGARADLTFTVAFDRDADNSYQARTLTADITLVAGQTIIPMIIDVHPSSWPNPINPGAKGNIPVAVNGSAALDVHMLNWRTARFGPGQAEPLRHSYEDWNGDGYTDLMLKFDNRESAFRCGMTDARLTIRDQNGTLYEGSDPIVTPPCR